MTAPHQLQANKEALHSLVGKHIAFKPMAPTDAKAIHQYASDPVVKRYIGWPLMTTEAETESFVKLMIDREAAGTHLYVNVILNEQADPEHPQSHPTVIGTGILFNINTEDSHAEIGYVFHQAHWGKGYGSELVALMTDFAFNTLSLHRIYAHVVDVNQASKRILEKQGYHQEGQMKDHYNIDGTYHDCLILGKVNRQEGSNKK